MSELSVLIEEYYQRRNLIWPKSHEGILWAITEMAEAIELLMPELNNWVRNHPDNRPSEFESGKFEEELGDVIMMAQVAGMVRGLDPIQALRDKISEKLENE